MQVAFIKRLLYITSGVEEQHCSPEVKKYVALKQDDSWFKPAVQLGSLGLQMACSSHVYVSFVLDLWFPPLA